MCKSQNLAPLASLKLSSLSYLNRIKGSFVINIQILSTKQVLARLFPHTVSSFPDGYTALLKLWRR